MSSKPHYEKAIENLRLFKRPPTKEQIDKTIKRLGLHAIQFERIAGIPEGTIYNLRQGTRKLPMRYWHLIYNQIDMTPGVPLVPLTKNLTATSIQRPAKIHKRNCQSGRLTSLK